jgi:hypothetical protein
VLTLWKIDQKVKGKVVGASHGAVEDDGGNPYTAGRNSTSETKYGSFIDRFRKPV